MYDEIVENIIKYGKYFASPQISLRPIRLRQNKKLANEIIGMSKAKLRSTKANVVNEPLFFAGSVDYMVKNENGKKVYYVLETNGGNSRGYSAMPLAHWKEANECYAESLSFISSDNPVVIIGYPNTDLLLYEKIFLAEHLSKKIKGDGKESKVVQVKNLTAQMLNKGGLVILGSYAEILDRLSVYKNNYVYFDGKKVDVLIGDGIARRKPDIIEHLEKKDLKSLVINDIFFITDDKALTYLAVEEAREIMKKYDIEPIAFKRAKNKTQLTKKVKKIIKEIPEILVKPHGGSGGSGIDIISNKNHIKSKIESSIKHYHKKFGKKRNPFPYTICQRVHATPVEWNEALHHFDIRVYVGRKKDRVVPLGALMRIALEPFAGRFSKKSFVVNLSGYEGVDTDRGFGLKKESLYLFKLDKNDFSKMFAGACALIAYINNNYTDLTKLAAENE